ncbi:GreA/GreB family elongation factor [uncultured Oxalicibacterium sp.]|uniref:GreA/GreB family elongation factor n=1 Tax=uncultured Oxalicibacterium sp. TaxID=1168540 RepID=UPI002600C489|nr:GreA/GreB family elongation factor [uncultured Oxalicibacterium sp.]
MNKAFVKEGGDDDSVIPLPTMPSGVRNYITPQGFRQLQHEASALLGQTADTQAEPAAEREREQRIHYLQTRLETAQVVDPTIHDDGDPVRFGATVTFAYESGEQETVTIVGLDELDPAHGRISWLSPIAQALLNAEEGDYVQLETPGGEQELLIVAVRYPSV